MGTYSRHFFLLLLGPNVGDPPVQSCELDFRLGTMTRAALGSDYFRAVAERLL
jgi:hypothetical protein